MKLLRIEIEGFKNSDSKITVDFKNRLSILYGGNGSGKTTILMILHSILAQNENYLIKQNVRKIGILYSCEERITYINIILKSDKSGYDWDEYLRSDLNNSFSIFIGLQRGVPISYNTVPTGLIYEFLLYSNISKSILEIKKHDRSKIRLFASELAALVNRYRNRVSPSKKLIPDGRHILMDSIDMNVVKQALIDSYINVKDKISNKIFNALFETFQLAIEENSNKNIPELPEDIRNIIIKHKNVLIETLENTPDNGFKNIVIEKIRDIENTYNLNHLLENLLYKIVVELKNEKEELSILNNILDIFNEFLGTDKKIIVNKNGVSIECGNTNHEINDLSSGERHLLSFLVTLYLDENKRNFIFIDEPEISLNIIWKEKLLSLISQISPNSHIIVASHSQSVAQDHILSLSKINRELI